MERHGGLLDDIGCVVVAPFRKKTGWEPGTTLRFQLVANVGTDCCDLVACSAARKASDL